MGTLRWLVKGHNTIVSIHRYESEAIKSAMFYNDRYQTDEFYVQKFNKKKVDNWLEEAKNSPVDGV